LPPVTLGPNRFWLKLEVKAQARFYWSLDGKRWEKVPAYTLPPLMLQEDTPALGARLCPLWAGYPFRGR
ncbi:MAG: hypothetical protein IJT74_00490, partial [Bacteroidales bacterium]|nr:hypothetical protein [Bacteroidales bacterium]